jgi:hypothetical protein
MVYNGIDPNDNSGIQRFLDWCYNLDACGILGSLIPLSKLISDTHAAATYILVEQWVTPHRHIDSANAVANFCLKDSKIHTMSSSTG